MGGPTLTPTPETRQWSRPRVADSHIPPPPTPEAGPGSPSLTGLAGHPVQSAPSEAPRMPRLQRALAIVAKALSSCITALSCGLCRSSSQGHLQRRLAREYRLLGNECLEAARLLVDRRDQPRKAAKLTEALEYEQLALNELLELADLQPTDDSVQADIASVRHQIAATSRWLGKWQNRVALAYRENGWTDRGAQELKKAREYHELEVFHLRKLADLQPDSAALQRALASAWLWVDLTTSPQTPQERLHCRQMSQKHYQNALQITEQLAPDSSHDPGLQQQLALAYNDLGQAQYAVGRAHSAVGDNHAAIERFQAAIASHDAAAAITDRLLGRQPGGELRQTHTLACERLWDLHGRLGAMFLNRRPPDLQLARDHYQRTLEYLQNLEEDARRAQGTPDAADYAAWPGYFPKAKTEYKQMLSDTYGFIGDQQLHEGHPAAAQQNYQQALAMIRDLPPTEERQGDRERLTGRIDRLQPVTTPDPS
jgi:hypothetical protein